MKLNNTLKSTLRVAKMELNTMLYSPVAWLILLIFVCQIGFSFSGAFAKVAHAKDIENSLNGITASIFSGVGSILKPILSNLYLYIPLITMGLMSREYQTGSIKLLYSSPIKNSSIILGKFLSMMIYGLVLLGILFFITLFCTIFVENFDYPVLLSALLGFYLLILAYSAIGLFMSSITQYQVVAAIGTLALLGALNYVGKIGQSIDFVRDLTYWLSMSNRSHPFIEGLLSSEDIIYYIIIIVFFLLLSIFKLNTEKTIMSRKQKFTGYAVIVLVTIGLGYVTSRPQFKFYKDLTQDKFNSLTPESQSIVKEIKKQKGDLKIVTYVNVLGENYSVGLPQNRIMDIRRYQYYTRFMPGITMEYFYYYDFEGDASSGKKRPNDEELKKAAMEACTLAELDFNSVLSPEEFKKQHLDLSSEQNRLLRFFKAKDGSEVLLRMYDDRMRYPVEDEITAALRRLVSKAPMVAFSKGYGSREIDNYGGRGYNLFANDKWSRESLLNIGFDTKVVDLDGEELDGIDVLVISDLKEELSPVALAKVQKYIEQGGNLFILGEYQRSANMNKLTSSLGIVFSDGVLVEPSRLHSPTVVGAKFTQEAADKYFAYTNLKRNNVGASAKTSTALDYSKAIELGFDVTPVLKSSKKSWLEYETTDFVDGEFICNPASGEKMGESTVLLTMSRDINGKNQRIVVSGDSDIISNEELTGGYPNMRSQNYSIVKGSFRWLSYDKFPIDTRRVSKIDNDIRLPFGSGKYVKFLFVVFIPLCVLVFGGVLIVRRQRK